MTDLELVNAFATDVADNNGRVLFVGGYARDSLLRSWGKKVVSKDIDLEVYGLDSDTIQILVSRYGTVNLVGASFGVIKIGQNIDISLPRKDSKIALGHTGFLINTDPTMSVMEAARRRDFTINSLAIDVLNGEIIDTHNGASDLKMGILRATDPKLFGDDSLRVLRAMQLSARYNLSLSKATIELCKTIDLHDLPFERIGEEWKKLLLKAEKPSVGLEVARATGVLDQLHPALAVLEQVEQDKTWHAEGNVWEHTKLAVDKAAEIIRRDKMNETAALELMLSVLCHDIGKVSTTECSEKGRITSYGHAQVGSQLVTTFLKQLALPNQMLSTVPKLIADHMFLNLNPTPSDSALRRLAQRLYPATILQLLRLAEADKLGRISANMNIVHLQQIAIQAARLDVSSDKPKPLIQGRDLIKFGVEPGPEMGKLLYTLFNHQLEGDFSDHENGLAFARVLVNKIIK